MKEEHSNERLIGPYHQNLAAADGANCPFAAASRMSAATAVNDVGRAGNVNDGIDEGRRRRREK